MTRGFTGGFLAGHRSRLLAIFMALAACVMLHATASLAYRATPPAAPGEIADLRIPARTMRHILERHGPDSTAPGAGKFAPGTTPEMIRAMIREGVQRGRAGRNTNGRPGTLYDYAFPHDIGVSIDGRPTRRLRVVVAPDGSVVTAFPR